MSTINVENHGNGKSPKGVGSPATNSGITTSAGDRFDDKCRSFYCTMAMSTSLKIPPGQYEHVSTDASGNWTYAPADR